MNAQQHLGSAKRLSEILICDAWLGLGFMGLSEIMFLFCYYNFELPRSLEHC